MLEIFAENGKYRLIEGYGPYMNKRYEVQEKYTYYNENLEPVTSWHMECHSSDFDTAKQMYKRRIERTEHEQKRSCCDIEEFNFD